MRTGPGAFLAASTMALAIGIGQPVEAGSPRDNPPELGQALLHVSTGHFEAAEVELREVIERLRVGGSRPVLALAQLYLGFTLSQLGRRSDAEAAMATAARLDSDVLPGPELPSSFAAWLKDVKRKVKEEDKRRTESEKEVARQQERQRREQVNRGRGGGLGDAAKVVGALALVGGAVYALVVLGAVDATFTVSPEGTAVAGATVLTFTVSKPEPDVSYRWDLGDGSTSSSSPVRYTYSRAGTFTVTLEATRESGLKSSASTTAQVAVRDVTGVWGVEMAGESGTLRFTQSGTFLGGDYATNAAQASLSGRISDPRRFTISVRTSLGERTVDGEFDSSVAASSICLHRDERGLTKNCRLARR